MTELILTEKRGHVLTIALNRPEKKNALNAEMFRGLSSAYTQLCDDPELRCGVLYSTSDIFSAGLDLLDMAPALMNDAGDDRPVMTEDDQVDPFNWASVSGKIGRLRTKPLVAAINSRCYAGGIEVALGADILIGDEDAIFAQAEIRRGLMPIGGAIERFTTRFGWGNAMRWLLTGGTFDAQEAHRIGLIQEIVSAGNAFERAMDIANEISSAAPLGVQGTLENAHLAVMNGTQEAASHMLPYMIEKISRSKDLQEGITAMFEKRDPRYVGA